MIRFFSLFLIGMAAPASAHSLGAAHLHSDETLMLAGAVALIVTALGLALARARR